MTGLNPTPEQLQRLKAAFRELKAEQDQYLRQVESRTFVHTHVYRQVRDERKCLLIGRKGSGSVRSGRCSTFVTRRFMIN